MNIVSWSRRKLLRALYRQLSFVFPKRVDPIKSKAGISTLLYHDGVDMSIYSLSSFFYQIGFSLPVFAVQDGSLTSKDWSKLRKFFHLRLLNEKKARNMMRKAMAEYPELLEYRLKYSSPYTKLKFDAVFLSPFRRVIFIESDLLFYYPPNEIKDWITSNSSEFLYLDHDRNYLGSDKRGDLDFSFRILLDKYRFKLASPTFNAGILCIPDKNRFNFKKLDKIFRLFNSLKYSKTIFAEETAWAILYNDLNNEVLPTKKYVCPVTTEEYLKATSRQVNAVHYIGESQQFFIRDAVRNAVRNRFFRSY